MELSIKNQQTYREFAKAKELPIFYQPWYLDAVCNEGIWDVAFVKRDKTIIGIWPYYLKRKYGFQYCTLPPLTPYLGPLLFDESQNLKNTTRLKQEKKMLTQLAQQLPKTILFLSQGMPNWKNWLPLSWANFKQTTRFTYIIDLDKSEQIIKDQLSDKTRNQILSRIDKLEIRKSTDAPLSYKIIKRTFDRQGLKVPYTEGFYKNLIESLTLQGAINTYIAYVSEKSVASVSVINDQSSAYLITTGREDDAPPGTIAALIWKSILEAKENKLSKFDFEGSMVQKIESFFRSFGGVQTPYHRISRTPNKWIRLLLEVLNRM